MKGPAGEPDFGGIMYRSFLLSKPIAVLVRLALTIRSEQLRLLNVFNDVEAMSKRD